jgi:hypothetical protein
MYPFVSGLGIISNKVGIFESDSIGRQSANLSVSKQTDMGTLVLFWFEQDT